MGNNATKNDKTEHVGNDVLKRKIILYFSSVYPITVNLMSMRHFLKKMGFIFSNDQIHKVFQILSDEGIIIQNTLEQDKWALSPSLKVLKKIAKEQLENEDKYIFTQSPFVQELADKDLFIKNAPLFKKAVSGMSKELLSHIGCDETEKSVNELYESVINELDTVEGLASQPELLYWFLYPGDMAKRIKKIYEAIGPLCMHNLMEEDVGSDHNE